MEEEKNFHFYWDSSSPFSDDYISEFIVEDIVFCFLNQYMFYMKADFFGDEDKKIEALASNTPSDLKAVNQNVKNFNPDQWYNESYWLYEKGINAKYTQNESLRRLLVESYPKYILRVPESSRRQILNSDPSYLNSEELYERQWRNFLLMEYRNNMIFKDTDLYKSVTEPFDENMSALPGFYSDQYVGDKNDQNCADRDSQTTVQESLNSEEQRGTSPGKNGADTESKYLDSSETLDNNDGRGIINNKSFSNETTEDKHANNESVTKEQMESNQGEYSRCHDDGSVESEQQGLKQENNNGKPSNSQNLKKENSVRVLKKDRKNVKYRPSNLYFYNDNSGLSNSYECEITLNHINFRSIDEYMLYRKAELFQDESVKEKILRGEQTDWNVNNFDRDVWFKKRKELYFEGIRAKFSQNPGLQNLLLKTHPKTIVYVRSVWVKEDIDWYGLDDWYMNRHHWSEVLQMKLRDELIAEGEKDQKTWVSDNESAHNPKSKKGKENKGHAYQEDNKEEVTIPKSQSSKRRKNRSSDKIKNKEEKNQPQPSIDDNENGAGDDHRNPDEDQGNTDLLPEALNSGEHIVVKVDSTGQRKTEIESMGVENTGSKSVHEEEQHTTDTDKLSSAETEKNTCSTELEENSKSVTALNGSNSTTKGTSDTQITASGKSKKSNGYKARRREPESPTNNAEISHNDKTQKQSEQKTFQKQKKPLSKKEKNVNYRDRTLENIPRKNRCLLVEDGSELSADFQCQFNIDGVEFCSVSQYIQYCKADYFHDDELKAKIMKSTDIVNVSVDEITAQNFDPEAWYTEKAEDVTWSANEAKFMQNGHLKQILYGTYPSIIQDVATQSDTNIPLSRKSHRTQHRLKSVLTELRDELMRSENLID